MGTSFLVDKNFNFRLVVLAEDETYIRSQDYFTCLKYIAANPIGEPIVWDYVRYAQKILLFVLAYL